MSLLIYVGKFFINKQSSFNPFIVLDQLGCMYKHQKIGLHPVCVPMFFIDRMINEGKTNNSPTIAFDANSTVLVHPDLLLKLKLSNGTWSIAQVRIKKTTQGQDSHVHERWVQLFCCSLIQKHVCCISSVLMNNCSSYGNIDLILYNHSADVIQTVLKSNNYYLGIKPSLKNISVPQACISTSVSLSVIEYPDYHTDIALENSLLQYFNVSRIICVGDILVLPIVPSHTSSQSETSSVYIKITDIKCSRLCSIRTCHLTQSGQGKVFLSGSCTSSRIPIHDSIIDASGSLSIPPHLLVIYDHVKETIRSQLVGWDSDEHSIKTVTTCARQKILPAVHSTPSNCGHLLLIGSKVQVSVLVS